MSNGLKLSSQDTAASSELPIPNFGGKLYQLKRAGHPLNDGVAEAVSNDSSLEPVIPPLEMEGAACLHKSPHSHNVETQTTSGGKCDLFWFGFLTASESDSKHGYQFYHSASAAII